MNLEQLNALPLRTALFVPGNRDDRIGKALATAADAVIIDLEDAVPLAEKAGALTIASEAVKANSDRYVIVRVNALETGLAEADVAAIVPAGVKVIILPKVQDDVDFVRIDQLLSEAEKACGREVGDTKVIPLIETARGVVNGFAALSAPAASGRCLTAALGAADLTLDLGIVMTAGASELFVPRALLAMSCRAAGLAAPIDSPYMVSLKDEDGTRADAERARSLGFQGKLCVHPLQVAVCNEVFSPSAAEIEKALRVIAAFDEAVSKGSAAVQLDGKFIDTPVVKSAQKVLQIAAKTGQL